MVEVQESEAMENKIYQYLFIGFFLIMSFISCRNSDRERANIPYDQSTTLVDTSTEVNIDTAEMASVDSIIENEFHPDISINDVFYLLEPVEDEKISELLKEYNYTNGSINVLNEGNTQLLK